MTDKIPCPECGGAREQQIGRLRLRCQFCHGEGQVGGDNEPAGNDEPRYTAEGWKVPEEGDTYDPDVHGPLPPAQEHPAVESVGASGVCMTCLGAGEVIELGDIYRQVPDKLLRKPCPDCGG